MKAFIQDNRPKNAFFKALYKSINWKFVLRKLRKKHRLIIKDDVIYVDGDFVVHDNEPACRLDIDVTIRLSMICDKSGNCLKLTATHPDREHKINFSEKQQNLFDKMHDSRRQKMAAMAPGLADMIADINNENF